MGMEPAGHDEREQPAPEAVKSPTVAAFPQVLAWLTAAAQPVPGPWPPHQQPRPDPSDEALPVAIVEPPRAGERNNEQAGSG